MVNVQNNDGVTPLYAAAIQGQDEVTEILIEHGAKTDRVCVRSNGHIKKDKPIIR